MIYLFDREKTVMRGIDYDDFTSILQKEVTNGVIDLNLETHVVKVLKDEKKPTNLKRLFENVEFVGHFDHNKEFQMYRIIKPSVDNRKLHFKAAHIFHDEGQAGEVIHDRRWRDSQAHTVISDVYAYIGWEVTEYDSSRVLHTNAFRQTPAQIRAEVIDRYGVEIQPYLEFDGKHITRKCIRVKQRIGEETYDRFDYGTDLLKITQEEDRGDIFTAVIPRGNGEEGVANSKIEIDGITWSTANGNPVNKPKGQNWIEVPSATQQYGYVEDGKVKPRKIVMDFDTDSVSELIDLAWDWINENAVPKSLMETEIFKVGRNYNLGDSIGIVYKQADIIKKARIHEAVRDLKRPAFTKFVVGDYDYFIKNTVTRQYRKKLNNIEQSTSAGLEKMNENFNNKFDEQVQRIDDKAQEVKDFAEANTTAKVEAHKELWEQKNTEIDNSIKKIIGGDISLLDTNIIDMGNTLGQKIELKDLEPIKSDLNTTRTNLQNQLDAARADLDGLEVGGRNLLLKSNDYVDNRNEELKINIDGEVYAEVGYIWGYNFDVNLKKGETYTISVPVYNNSETESSIARISGFLGNNLKRIEPKEKRLFTVTGTADEDYVGKIYILTNSGNVPLYYGYAKLEKGTIATDWMPAPEDTEEKITTLNQQIEFIDGQLSAKLEQTDLLSINNKITEYGNSLTANAQSIESLISKTELHDGDITKWRNETVANAERIGTILEKNSEQDNDITQWKNETISTAEKVETNLSKLSEVDGSIEQLNTNVSTQAGRINTVLSKQSEHGNSIASLINTSEENSSTLGTMKSDLGIIQQDVSTVKQTASTLRQEFVSMSGTVEGLESWRSEKGAVYDAAADGFRFKVWRDDVLTGGVNFFRNTDFSSLTDIDAWRRLVGQVSRSWSQFALIQNLNFGSFFGLISEINVEIVKGKTYTVSFLGAHDSGVDTINRVFLLDKDLKSVQNLNQYRKYKYLENPHVTGQFNYGLYYFTFTAEVTQTIGICISATHNGDPNTGGWIRLSEPQFEEGNVPSSYKPPIGEYMHQTDFVIKAGSFLLGNREVGGDVFASGIVGDASGLKLLGDNIDVQGNLNVQNSVNTWAVNAVSANIGKVFADSVTSSFIKAKHVEFDTTFINELVNKTAFIDNAQIKASNIRDLTANNIRGGVLQDTGDNFNWNLNTGRFAIKKSTLVYEEPGNAIVHGVHTQAAGIHFNRTSSGLPVVVMGTSPNVGTYANPRIDSNHVTFSGIRVFSNINEIDMTANNFRFRSEAGSGSRYDRGLYLQTYDVNASTDVVLEPFSNRSDVYKHYLGRSSNPFEGLYVSNIWGSQVRNSGSGVAFYSKNGKYGISVSDGGVFAVKDGKFTTILI